MIRTTIGYYGDKYKGFYGRVINVNDPLQLGRVQVRAVGIHSENLDELPNADLPWAMVLIPPTEGGVSGIGLNGGLKPFSLVYGYFVDGDNAQEPLVLGSLPSYQRDPEMIFDEVDNINEIRNLPVPKPDNIDDLLYGVTNLEKAWHWFKGTHGGSYSAPVISGILGNLWVESFATINDNDLNPAAEQVGGGPGFGLAQWERTGDYNDRYLELVKRSAGLPITSMTAQLRFISYELDKYSYLGKSELVLATTPEQASDIFMIKYERPKKHTFPLLKPKSLGGTGTDDKVSVEYSSAKARRKASRNIFNNFSV